MSLENTATIVWQTKQPPLGLLVTAKASELLGSDLSAEVQAPFLALSRAVVRWWPKRQPTPALLHENEFSACVAAAGDKPPAQLEPLLAAAALQMAALVKVAGRLSMLSDDFLELDEGDFEKLLRGAAKVGRIPVAQLEARLKHLLEHVKEPWAQLVVRAERMPWTRGAAWGKLDKRVRELVALADLGAAASWTGGAGRLTLQLELDGVKRIATLSPEELAALKKLVPGLPDPA